MSTGSTLRAGCSCCSHGGHSVSLARCMNEEAPCAPKQSQPPLVTDQPHLPLLRRGHPLQAHTWLSSLDSPSSNHSPSLEHPPPRPAFAGQPSPRAGGGKQGLAQGAEGRRGHSLPGDFSTSPPAHLPPDGRDSCPGHPHPSQFSRAPSATCPPCPVLQGTLGHMPTLLLQGHLTSSEKHLCDRRPPLNNPLHTRPLAGPAHRELGRPPGHSP